MAVFTEVSFDQAAELLERLNLGPLQTFKGIPAGIENTNYFADTSKGRYVLTVFERLTFEQLPFYLHLMKHLARKGVAVPDPQADAAGEILHRLLGKPAAVVNRLAGGHHLAPSADHCAQVGSALARMHLAGRDYPRHQPNLRGLPWWAETVPVVLPFLSADQSVLIQNELLFQQQLAASTSYAELPRGPIHADLFRDNVMFDGDRLSGFFDFYFAGVDTDLFDIAVCLNDWCIDLQTGKLEEERANAFVAAYDRERALTTVELRLLPALMRAGALRFWISRLWDFHLPRQASVLKPHDPAHFERVLRCRINNPWHYERA
ncbi:MAG: homoserine kinase [Burkholderiales bacterium]